MTTARQRTAAALTAARMTNQWRRTSTSRARPVTIPADELAAAVDAGNAMRASLSADARGDRVREMAAQCNYDPFTLAAYLRKKYAASTAATYFNIAMARGWMRPLSKLQRRRLTNCMNSDIETKQAPTATPSAFLAARNAKEWPTIVLCLMSASRHADISRLKLLEHHRLADRGTEVIMMRLGRNKSDPTGKKKCIKVIEASPQIVQWCLQGLAAPASYFRTWLALRPLGLTPHSGRASAATFLAENYDAEEIRILTAHAGPDDATSTRKYVRPNINHKIAKRMREMTTLIGRSLLPW